MHSAKLVPGGKKAMMLSRVITKNDVLESFKAAPRTTSVKYPTSRFLSLESFLKSKTAIFLPLQNPLPPKTGPAKNCHLNDASHRHALPF